MKADDVTADSLEVEYNHLREQRERSKQAIVERRVETD
jgi:hypothetical protein